MAMLRYRIWTDERGERVLGWGGVRVKLERGGWRAPPGLARTCILDPPPPFPPAFEAAGIPPSDACRHDPRSRASFFSPAGDCSKVRAAAACRSTCSTAVATRTKRSTYSTGCPNGTAPPQQTHMFSMVETPLQASTVTDPIIEQSST
eukprot:scaffold1394_cov109-Isochrysis_galbana.AAC.3